MHSFNPQKNNRLLNWLVVPFGTIHVVINSRTRSLVMKEIGNLLSTSVGRKLQLIKSAQ